MLRGATATTANAFVGTLGSGPGQSVAGAFQSGRWDVAKDLVGGQSGANVLVGSVLNSTITAGRLFVGRSPGSIGEVSAAGDGLIHVLGNATLGGGGDATLRVDGGGSITIDGALSYDRRSVIDLRSGTLDVGSLVRQDDALDRGGILPVDGGLLRVRSDTSTYDLELSAISLFSRVQTDGALDLDDRQALRILDTGTLQADSWTGNGELAVFGGGLELGELMLGVAPGARTTLTLGDPQAPAVFTNLFSVAGASQIQAGADLTMSRTSATFEGTLLNFGSMTIDRSNAQFNGVGLFDLNGLVTDAALTISDSTIGGEVIATENSSVTLAGSVVFNGPVRTEADLTSITDAPGDLPSVTFNQGLHFGFGALDDFRQITIDADVLLGDGNTLVFEIGGATPGDYDSLIVAGLLELGGRIEIVALPGYEPMAGDVFNLFSADSTAGTFNEIIVTNLPNDLFADLDELQAGTIRVPEPGATAGSLIALISVLALHGWRSRAARPSST